jgi:hypothetical protein
VLLFPGLLELFPGKLEVAGRLCWPADCWLEDCWPDEVAKRELLDREPASARRMDRVPVLSDDGLVLLVAGGVVLD